MGQANRFFADSSEMLYRYKNFYVECIRNELQERPIVAACLGSLRANDSPDKGHHRIVRQRLKLYKYWNYI